MAETLLRQWVMLRRIPRAPRWVDTAGLESHLENEGYAVTRRTIQRDLQTLAASGQFPLDCHDEDPQHLRWYWIEGAEVMDVPGMSPAAAVAFGMASDFLKPLLPTSVLSHLRPYFDRAAKLLGAGESNLSLWPERVRVIDRGPAMLPPKVDAAAQEAIYDGLLKDRALLVRYRARGAGRAKEHTIHPLGLVARLGLIYLVCRYDGHDDVRHVALHRMRSAEVLQTPCEAPAGFDLDEHLESGAFGYPVTQKQLRLRLRLDKATAIHLEESPLAKDQKVRTDGDAHVRLDATVADTQELRWWLLGLGANVTVVGPVALRREMAATITAMAAAYR